MPTDEYDYNEFPLAYLITFRCYGTWLHGDARGSVDREQNVYGTPFLPRDEARENEERLRLKHPPVTLDEASRLIVEQTIPEVCQYRGWALRAISVRTNHAHAVVSAQCHPDKVLNDFKAYCTRRMKEDGLWKSKTSPWAEHGSKRYLWKEQNVARAIDYVLNHQGDALPPDFDDPGKPF